MPPSAENDDDHAGDDAGLEPLPGGDGAPPIDFTTFILSMSTSCMIHLGEIAAPEGGTELDLEAARHTIEILQMLDRKTEGQLTGEEDRMLAHVIDDLRTRYLARYRAR